MNLKRGSHTNDWKLHPATLRCMIMLLVVSGLCLPLQAQTTWSERQVVEQALQYYPSLRIAELEVQQAKALERTAFNPQQPRVTIETPADIGIGVEVEQEFAFPDVYFKRGRWLKSKTALAMESGTLSREELIRDVRVAFLEAQVAQSRYPYYTRQDSIWRELASSSQRLYDSGSITKADLIFAQHTSGTTLLAKNHAQVEMENKRGQLELYSGASVPLLDPLVILEKEDTTGGFYFEQYYLQKQVVAENESRVWRAQRAPDILLGYLRAPEPDTEYRNRFKAGLTIPIFQGQYSGEIKAAKYDQQQAAQELELKQREAAIAIAQWNAIRTQAADGIEWYEQTGLQQQSSLSEINMRLFDAGEIDYARALRNASEAIALQNAYFDLVERHNRAVIELEFLKGHGHE